MSAFPNSGRLDQAKSTNLKVRFRPQADMTTRFSPADLSDRFLNTVFLVISLPSHRTVLSADDEPDHSLIQSPHFVQLVLTSSSCESIFLYSLAILTS